MKKIVFSLILLLVSFSSFSQDDEGYKVIAISKEGDIYSVYIEKSEGDITKFWLKVATPIKTIEGENGKTIIKGGDKMIHFVIMDCSEKTYSTSDYVYYDRFGKSGNGGSSFDKYNKRVIPGTNMNFIYNYICKKE